MSRNEDDNEDSRASHSFDGIGVPSRVSLTLDDDEEEEVVRRVGGTAVMPAFHLVEEATALPRFSEPSMLAERSTLQPKPSVEPRTIPAPVTGKPIWSPQVPELAEYHPLERTAVFVPNAVPEEIATRICDVLRDRSIEAVYDDDKAKVKCITAEGVDFRIRLYRGRKSFSHGIIVEVQRRFGVSNNFYKDTMAILDAAEGKEVPPPPSFGSSSNNNMPMVSDSEDEYVADGTSSLEMVAKMFGHSGYDSHYLAFQTLVALTDSSKMGFSTSRAVSTELLQQDKNQVGKQVLALVLAKNDKEDMFNLRSMAMTVLANAIQATKGKIEPSLRERLRPVLIEELYNAEKNPRTAQMAGQCVEYLLQDDHDAAEFHDALEKAVQVGKARHAGLERQAQRCLDKQMQAAGQRMR